MKPAITKIIIISSLMLLLSADVFAQSGNNPCQVPFTPCWCAKNPGPCANQGIPINNELWVLLLAGLAFGVYWMKKNKT